MTMSKSEKLALLQSEIRSQRAAKDVKSYLEPDGNGTPRFTGSQFEVLDGGGDREDVANRFTAADLVALSLLGVPVSGAAAIELLDDREGRWSRILAEIPASLDPVTGARQLTDEGSAAHRLYSTVRALPDMGPTRTSKLLARKRPQLIPVYDSVIERLVAPGNRWWKLVADLFEDSANVERLHEVRREAGADGILSLLRTLDVILWMRHRGPVVG